MRSATDLSKADLHVFSKLFDDGLEGVTSRFAQNCPLRWRAQTTYLSARFRKRVLQQKILDPTFRPQTFQIPPFVKAAEFVEVLS
jgi:hypothetical protein